MEFHEQWELYRQRVEEGIDWWVFGIPANRQPLDEEGSARPRKN